MTEPLGSSADTGTPAGTGFQDADGNAVALAEVTARVATLLQERVTVVARVTTALAHLRPALAATLLQAEITVTNDTATIALSSASAEDRLELLVNPEFISSLDDAELADLLAREVTHMLLAQAPVARAYTDTWDRWEVELDAQREALRQAGVPIDEEDIWWTRHLSAEAIARLDAIEGDDVPPLKRMTADFGNPSRLDLASAEDLQTGTAWDVSTEVLVNELPADATAKPNSSGWQLKRRPQAPGATPGPRAL